MADRFNSNGHSFSKTAQPDSGGFRGDADTRQSAVDRRLDQALQALYEEVLAEPVPKHLIDIIESRTGEDPY